MQHSHTQNATRGPWRNLGTYSNVLHEDELRKMFMAAAEMNFVDKAAYPEVAAMEQETVQFLAQAMHGNKNSAGLATTGSSEAIILALAWHHRNFVAKHPELKEQELNFIVNEGHHKSFEKYARLFGAELRSIPLGQDLRADVVAAAQLIDSRTFCVVGIAGSTELGMVDNIAALAKLAKKHRIPMHVDAAAGGYVLPFTGHSSSWDFALPAVQTINVSAHKYGLCLPGVGFLLARSAAVMPANYSGKIAYLSGGCVEDNALSCTRNAAFVVNAYHNSKRYGAEGYRQIAQQNLGNADYLARQLQGLPSVTRVTNGDVPVVTFGHEAIEELSAHLTTRGWIQSPHAIAKLGHKSIRVVVRRHITRSVIEELLTDIINFSHAATHSAWQQSWPAIAANK